MARCLLLLARFVCQASSTFSLQILLNMPCLGVAAATSPTRFVTHHKNHNGQPMFELLPCTPDKTREIGVQHRGKPWGPAADVYAPGSSIMGILEGLLLMFGTVGVQHHGRKPMGAWGRALCRHHCSTCGARPKRVRRLDVMLTYLLYNTGCLKRAQNPTCGCRARPARRGRPWRRAASARRAGPRRPGSGAAAHSARPPGAARPAAASRGSPRPR